MAAAHPAHLEVLRGLDWSPLRKGVPELAGTAAPARPQKKPSKKARRRGVAEPRAGTMTPRWRASGLVNKAVITRVLESNGARRAE